MVILCMKRKAQFVFSWLQPVLPRSIMTRVHCKAWGLIIVDPGRMSN